MDITKIVVGTDFSPGASVALKQALDIAAHVGAEIILVHATDLQSRTQDAPFDDPPAEWLAALDELARERGTRLDELREQFADRGVKMTTRAGDNAPSKAIIEVSEEVGAELIVVGTTGRSGLMRFVLGSVAMRVVRRSKANVLVARPRPEGSTGFRNHILVPTDFSTSSRAAVEMATALVKRDGTIDLAHFWQLPAETVGSWTATQRTLGKHVESLNTMFASAAEKQGAELADAHRRDGIEISFSQSRKIPKVGIQHKLESAPFDLVIMGSRGHRRLKRWLLGSVAESTVRHAPCSVLIAR
jgi:nucleotide-binding universal stress UspA family protein